MITTVLLKLNEHTGRFPLPAKPVFASAKLKDKEMNMLFNIKLSNKFETLVLPKMQIVRQYGGIWSHAIKKWRNQQLGAARNCMMNGSPKRRGTRSLKGKRIWMPMYQFFKYTSKAVIGGLTKKSRTVHGQIRETTLSKK